jgi:hypothetical protein
MLVQALDDLRIREGLPVLEEVQAHHQAKRLGVPPELVVIGPQRQRDRLPIPLPRQHQPCMGGVQSLWHQPAPYRRLSRHLDGHVGLPRGQRVEWSARPSTLRPRQRRRKQKRVVESSTWPYCLTLSEPIFQCELVSRQN